ncbi:maleylacetoacetate isomerase [Babesia caballi]|uniref:Maleylacetoacetate isomerase n=1 Tax=Babesia caballi TaxID=5871 RepID=A0AAV4LRC6_BABCB|nr:maleylacetoacetate isomerase [Babesia caballi]
MAVHLPNQQVSVHGRGRCRHRPPQNLQRLLEPPHVVVNPRSHQLHDHQVVLGNHPVLSLAPRGAAWPTLRFPNAVAQGKPPGEVLLVLGEQHHQAVRHAERAPVHEVLEHTDASHFDERLHDFVELPRVVVHSKGRSQRPAQIVVRFDFTQRLQQDTALLLREFPAEEEQRVPRPGLDLRTRAVQTVPCDGVLSQVVRIAVAAKKKLFIPGGVHGTLRLLPHRADVPVERPVDHVLPAPVAGGVLSVNVHYLLAQHYRRKHAPQHLVQKLRLPWHLRGICAPRTLSTTVARSVRSGMRKRHLENAPVPDRLVRDDKQNRVPGVIRVNLHQCPARFVRKVPLLRPDGGLDQVIQPHDVVQYNRFLCRQHLDALLVPLALLQYHCPVQHGRADLERLRAVVAAEDELRLGHHLARRLDVPAHVLREGEGHPLLEVLHPDLQRLARVLAERRVVVHLDRQRAYVLHQPVVLGVHFERHREALQRVLFELPLLVHHSQHVPAQVAPQVVPEPLPRELQGLILLGGVDVGEQQRSEGEHLSVLGVLGN